MPQLSHFITNYFLMFLQIVQSSAVAHTMAIADKLIEKIFIWLKQQELCAQRLEDLASELEEHRKNVRISKVVGGSVTVLGAAAVTAAGVATICTGGLAAPALVAAVSVAGSVGAGLGAATSLGSDIAETIISSCKYEEANKAAERSMDLEKEIQRLIGLLEKEAEKEKQKACARNEAPKEYIMDSILKALAKHCGLQWNDNFKSLTKISDLTKKMDFEKDAAGVVLHGLAAVGLPLLTKFVSKFVSKAIFKEAAKNAGKTALTVGAKATAKAIGRVSICRQS